MIALVGIIIVIAAVIGGYLLEHGNLLVLFQPAELVIIGGASLGTVFIANPMRTILALVKGIGGAFRGSRYTKDVYMKTLAMMYELFTTTKKKDSAFLNERLTTQKRLRFCPSIPF